MKLTRALGIGAGETVAFVGAGGKTSALFALAQEWETGPVVLTTTTHLGAWQAPLAERHLIVQPGDDLLSLLPNEFHTLLLTGPAGADDRLTAVGGGALNELRVLCRQRGWTLLIEADGARRRPLKAPAEYEPVVPPWADAVVVVAGLEALGQPLSAQSVHRPERFAALTGLAEGDGITVESVVALLASPQGGLQGLPEGARRLLFLNQADSEMAQARGQRLAKALCEVYSNILIGSLHAPGQSGPVFSVQSPVAGVVLAAGGSQRLGRPKQLLMWKGQPFIRQVCQNALEAGLAPLVVVTGARSEEIRPAIADLPVQVVHNPGWAGGQSTSLRAGLAALPGTCQGVMFLLSDQPQAGPSLIRQLVERFYVRRAPVTAPLVAGRRGNPVLFARETFNALSGVQGDRGGRAVFGQFEADWLPWMDKRVLLDVDGEGDYERLTGAYFNLG